MIGASSRDTVRIWAWLVTVAGLPLVVNPFGTPAFGIPRLSWLRIGAALIGVLLVFELTHRSSARSVRSSAWPALALVAASAVLSTLFSVSPVVSVFGAYLRWEGLWTLACYWLLFVAGVRWGRNRPLLTWVAPSMAVGALAVSMVGLLEFFGVARIGAGMELFCAAGFGSSKAVSDRIIATCGNAAFLGGYLCMMVPLGLAMALTDEPPRPWWRWLGASTAGAAGVTLVLTYARAAWLGAIVGLIALVWAMRPDRKRTIAIAVAVALALAAAGGVAAMTGRQGLLARIASSVDLRAGSVPQRLAILGDTIPMVRDHALVGVGLDAFGSAFGRYESVELLRSGGGGNLSTDRAHNDLLQVAATQGLIGLAAWLVFLAAYGEAALRALKTAPGGWPRAVIAGGIAATLAYLVQAQLEFSTFVVTPTFWALAGIVWAAASEHRSRPQGRLGPGGAWALRAAAVLAAGVTAAAALSFWAADAAYNQGIARLYARDAAGAIAAYERAVAAGPFEPLYAASLGSALLSAVASRDPSATVPAATVAEAEAHFARARALDPRSSTVDFLAGNAFVEFGARRDDRALADKAITAYERGLRTRPRSLQALTQVGRAYAFAGRWEDASAAWTRALQIDPDSATLSAYQGRALDELDMPDEAESAYRRALELDPANEAARAGLESLARRREGTSTGPGRP